MDKFVTITAQSKIGQICGACAPQGMNSRKSSVAARQVGLKAVRFVNPSRGSGAKWWKKNE